jgi:hypothetical protein
MVLTQGQKYVKVTHLSFHIVHGLFADDFCFSFLTSGGVLIAFIFFSELICIHSVI